MDEKGRKPGLSKTGEKGGSGAVLPQYSLDRKWATANWKSFFALKKKESHAKVSKGKPLGRYGGKS